MTGLALRDGSASATRNGNGTGDGSLGEALVTAQQAARDAETAFRDLVREAAERGASTRQMAKLLGVSNATVWRWLERTPAPRLDALGEPR